MPSSTSASGRGNTAAGARRQYCFTAKSRRLAVLSGVSDSRCTYSRTSRVTSSGIWLTHRLFDDEQNRHQAAARPNRPDDLGGRAFRELRAAGKVPVEGDGTEDGARFDERQAVLGRRGAHRLVSERAHGVPHALHGASRPATSCPRLRGQSAGWVASGSWISPSFTAASGWHRRRVRPTDRAPLPNSFVGGAGCSRRASVRSCTPGTPCRR